jgi:hypothetical protein
MSDWSSFFGTTCGLSKLLTAIEWLQTCQLNAQYHQADGWTHTFLWV